MGVSATVCISTASVFWLVSAVVVVFVVEFGFCLQQRFLNEIRRRKGRKRRTEVGIDGKEDGKKK
jgi:hypothetical protein